MDGTTHVTKTKGYNPAHFQGTDSCIRPDMYIGQSDQLKKAWCVQQKSIGCCQIADVHTAWCSKDGTISADISPVKHEKICAHLFFHELSQTHLVCTGEIAPYIHLASILLKHLHSLMPVDDARLLGECHGFGCILSANDRQLRGISLFQAGEDVTEHAVKHKKNLGT